MRIVGCTDDPTVSAAVCDFVVEDARCRDLEKKMSDYFLPPVPLQMQIHAKRRV